eukprot:1781536-Heterocapsa_arctica.AAC.1
MLDTGSFEQHEACKCKGRGWIATFQLRPAQAPNKMGDYYIDPCSTFWSSLHARLAELLKCRDTVQREHGRQLVRQQQREDIIRHVRVCPVDVARLRTPKFKSDFEQLRMNLVELHNFALGDLKELELEVGSLAEQAYRQFLNERSTGFK